MPASLFSPSNTTATKRKAAEEAYLRLQLKSKREAMDMLAKAYVIDALENGHERKTKRPRNRKMAFKIELSPKELRALEDLAAKSMLQKHSDSGTKSGTSP